VTTQRSAAALIAISVFATIALRIWLRMTGDGETFVQAVWGLYRFFTIWTNTLIGITCAAIAFGRPKTPQTLSNLLLSIIIVAAVYHALLARLNDFTGLDAVVDTMLHTVIPLAFVGFWLAYARKSKLTYNDILLWLVLPLVYCIYAMTRAQFDGVYPYFFLNLGHLGPTRTGLNVVGLLIAFSGVGAAIVVTAKLLSRLEARAQSSNP
jgi:hypothetical protein